MTIQTYKVRDADYSDKDVASLPVKPQMSAADLQASFDKLVKLVVAPKLNALIDALAASTGANEIGKTVSGMTGTTVGVPTAPTPAKTTSNAQIATTAFVQAVIADAVFQSGSADMAKATYDPQTKAQDIFAYADNAARLREFEVTLPADAWTKQSDNTYRQTVTVNGLEKSGYSYLTGVSGFNVCGVVLLDVAADHQAAFAAQTLPDAAVTVHLLKIGTRS